MTWFTRMKADITEDDLAQNGGKVFPQDSGKTRQGGGRFTPKKPNPRPNTQSDNPGLPPVE